MRIGKEAQPYYKMSIGNVRGTCALTFDHVCKIHRGLLDDNVWQAFKDWLQNPDKGLFVSGRFALGCLELHCCLRHWFGIGAFSFYPFLLSGGTQEATLWEVVEGGCSEECGYLVQNSRREISCALKSILRENQTILLNYFNFICQDDNLVKAGVYLFWNTKKQTKKVK